ncbi:MAG: helix-hairpin-helix domain-containing protein [Oscillospiraceae bacterium]
MKIKTSDISKFLRNNAVTILLIIFMILSGITAYVTSQMLYKDNEKRDHSIVAADKSTTTLTSTVKSTAKRSQKTTTKTSTTKTSKSSVANASFPIDINKVTFDELVQIDGIGSVTANSILSFRDNLGKITNMDLLLQINGIGSGKLELLKKYLYVSVADFEEPEITSKTDSSTADIVKEKSKTSLTTVIKTTETTTMREFRKVNINYADASEISEALIIDIDLAGEVVSLREKIHYFSNSLELLYIEEFTEKIYNERKDYILI